MSPPRDSAPESTPSHRRRRALVALAGASVVAGIGSVWAGTGIESTSQRAARAKPPPRSDITATVERRTLVEEQTLQGQVVPASTVEVPVPPVPAGADAVVTATPTPSGVDVAEGAVLAEVAGRPIFVLAGAVPMYRDLALGVEGRDVAQLQAGLARLGLKTGDKAGVFGSGTSRAVTTLYRRAGYTATTAAPPAPDGAAAAPGAAGATVPRGELVFVASLPVRLLPPGLHPGQRPQGALLSLGAGTTLVKVSLSPPTRVQADMAARVEARVGEEVPARVTAVAPDGEGSGAPGSSDAAGGALVAWLTPDHPLPPETLGRSVIVHIEIYRSPTEVLAVPITALYARPGGTSEVRVKAGSGTRHRAVEVRAGRSAGGFVEVTPVGGELGEGDRVLVGRK